MITKSLQVSPAIAVDSAPREPGAQRAGETVLSALAFYLPLAVVAVGVAGFESGVRSLWGPTGGGLVQVTLIALAVGVALFSVSLVSSLLTTGFRAIRQRNGVAFILSCAPLALAVVVLLVGLTDLDQLGIVPGYYPFWDAEWGIFGRLLMFQSGTVVTGSASALHANVMGALSWLTVMVGAALTGWSMRRARTRVGLPRVFLRDESLVTVGTAFAMFVSWVGLVGWGIGGIAHATVPAQVFCIGGWQTDLCSSRFRLAPIPGLAWWLVVGCMGIASMRALLAGGQSIRQFPRLVRPPGPQIAPLSKPSRNSAT